MGKRYIALILMFIVSIAGCGSKDDSLFDFREQKKEMVSYTESDHLKEQVCLGIIDVPIPEHAYVSSWAVYDDMVYYEADYIDYLTDYEGKGAIEPTAEHRTKVMSYDMQSGETKILYQAEDIIAITDLCTDGKILIWEEYPRLENVSWRIKMLSLTEKDSVAETIFSDGDTEGELWDIIPNLTEQKIYWYDQDDVEKDEHPIKLYSYDIKKEEIKLEKEGLDLASPYEQISIIDGKICTYEMHAPDGAKQKYFKTSSIYIEDREKNGKITLLTPSKIMHPVANEKFCIWGESYVSDDELWLYDYQSGQLECISLEMMGGKFAYMLLDDLIIVSTRNGIWCIEPETQTYTNMLLFGDEYSYGNIWHALDGNAYMQIDSSEEKISIAKMYKDHRS